MNNEHHNCLICSSSHISNIIGYENAFLVKCNQCGFVFSKKIPSDDELVKHYDNYSRDDYLSPITSQRFNELLDGFEKYRKTNKILDIGCGVGYFLEVAKSRGWECFGTEFTNEAIEINRQKGILMNEGPLQTKNYKENQFDIITSFEVIEHINNPLDEIEAIKKILRPSGLFYCTTPNFNSLSRKKYKQDWIMIDYPEHLSYYTAKTINYLFTQNGFKKKKVSTTGIRSQNIPISNIISEESKDEKLRNMAENSFLIGFAKKIINFLLSVTQTGDTIKAYFIKTPTQA
ncbi:MAG: hypothetical protein C0594_12910 [Marinilabiliales bacterium]|nr:MAG: hypothetical protein C0594_12910 [Marinilabiliales bacterium]